MATEKELHTVIDIEKESNKIILTLLALFVGVPLYQIYYIWAWGIVIQFAWAWFVVPAFAFQALTFIQAVAITAFSNVLYVKTAKIESPKNPDGSYDWKPILTALILPWIALAISAFTAWIFI